MKAYTTGTSMKSKKILSIAIAAAVVFNTTATVFATSEDRTKLMEAAGESQVALNPAIEQQAKITKDEAKKIAKTKLKEYLDQDLDESKFQVRIDFRPSYYNQKDDYVWEINWNANQALKSTNFRVSLNANTGKVISMGRSVYSQFEPQPTVPSITQEKAKEINADIVLYGHTHESKIDYINGIWYINPGSPSMPRDGFSSYATIEINREVVTPTIVSMNSL